MLKNNWGIIWAGIIETCKYLDESGEETLKAEGFPGTLDFHAKTQMISGELRQVSYSRARRDSRNDLDQPSQFTDLKIEHLSD